MAASLVITPEAAKANALATISGAPAATATFTLTRTSPSGATVSVRGAIDADYAEPTHVRDYEVPFGVPLTYTATFYDAARRTREGTVVGTVSAPFTMPYDGCQAWVVDLAYPTNSLPLTIETFSPLDFEVPAGVHRVLDRRAPVLVTLPAWTPDAELVLLTDTLAQRDALRNLLGSGYPFLLRTVPEQGIGNMFLGVTDFKEERFLTLGTAAPRRFTVEVVQVERPNAAVFRPVPPMTYQAVLDTWLTYANLLTGVDTYDALAYTYPGEGGKGTTTQDPWLPADV